MNIAGLLSPTRPASFRSPSTNWDDVYRERATNGTWGHNPLPFVAEAIRYLHESSARVVLDCACGDGRNLVPLAGALEFVVGSDLAASALLSAHGALQDDGVRNALLVLDDIADSRFVDASFDGVVCFELLSHLPDPRAALTELLRIAKPGACIIADVFGLDDSTRTADMTEIGPNEYLYENDFYFRYFDREETTRLATIPGTRLLAVENVSWIDPPHGTYRPYSHRHETWTVVLRKD